MCTPAVGRRPLAAASAVWWPAGRPRGGMGRRGAGATRRAGGQRLLPTHGGRLMDALLNVALAGTAHGGQAPVAASAPFDRLLAQLPADDPEQRILLTAGARAVYQQAGRQPRPGGALPA